MSVRTRFAPSPTGYLHIGGIRTALFSWLYARHTRGTFILRIEDTDRERSTQEAIDLILQGMEWLGLDYDEGPFHQTARFDRYRAVVRELLDSDRAYHCYCSKQELDAMRAEAMARGQKPKYDGRCRNRSGAPQDVNPVVRFKNPVEGEVIVDDLIQGRVAYQNAELDDLIIARSDGTPTYNLTVVVDDMDMRITHVIRGDDHLNNTPRQINIFRALDARPPEYAHLPLILAPGGKKLSKRDGAASVLEYREEGILPEALINYLVRLGWSHGDQEIFSLEEMIRLFDIHDVNKAAAAVNPEKLLWLNQHYLKAGDVGRLSRLFGRYLESLSLDTANGPPVEAVFAAQREREKTLREMAEQSWYFYKDIEHYDEQAAAKHLQAEALAPLTRFMELLDTLSGWDRESLHAAVKEAAAGCGVKLGKLAQPLRVAVTGGTVSPSIDVTLELLGRERTLSRLRQALEHIKTSPG